MELRRTVLLFGLSGLIGCTSSTPRYTGPEKTFYSAWLLIKENYLDATAIQPEWQDWDQVSQKYLSRPLLTPQAAYPLITKMVADLKDPYSRFYDPATYRNLQTQTTGNFTGVGFQELALDAATGLLTIVSPIDDSPAQKAGLRPGDRILTIDGKTTQGLDLEQAGYKLRGRAGTNVTLGIGRGQQTFTQTLQRVALTLKTLTTQLVTTPIKVGYLGLRAFSQQTPAQVRQAVQTFEQQGVEGYLIDLRRNSGGVIRSGEQVAGLFLEPGQPIVSLRTRQGTRPPVQAEGGPITTKPLVLLVDGGTASASEVCAAALQEQKRATILGTPTFGKGIVQRLYPLEDGAALSLTIASYRTPQGRDLQGQGLVPDTLLSSVETPKFEDSQVRTALDFLRISRS